jgi:hypothetical protein
MRPSSAGSAKALTRGPSYGPSLWVLRSPLPLRPSSFGGQVAPPENDMPKA